MRSAFRWGFDPHRPLFVTNDITFDHDPSPCLDYSSDCCLNLPEIKAKMFSRVVGTPVNYLVENLLGERLVLDVH